MLEVIDEDYLREIADMPDGWTRLLEMYSEGIRRAETAEEIARAVISQVKPLRQRRDELLRANTALVEEKRALLARLKPKQIRPDRPDPPGKPARPPSGMEHA